MNPVVHFEMPYENRDRMAKFYETAFGWQIQMLGEELGNYMLVTTAKSDAKPGAPAGAINGGFFSQAARRSIQPEWPIEAPSIVVGTTDIQESMDKVIQAGGTVLSEPVEIPGVGLFVSFMDTEGNRNSILQALAR